jgi:hypothetical protein
MSPANPPSMDFMPVTSFEDLNILRINRWILFFVRNKMDIYSILSWSDA